MRRRLSVERRRFAAASVNKFNKAAENLRCSASRLSSVSNTAAECDSVTKVYNSSPIRGILSSRDYKPAL